MELKNLVTKLIAVSEAVQSIAKNGHNNFQNYDYVTETDLVEKIRKELNEKKVFIFQSSKVGEVRMVEKKDGKSDILTTVETTFTLVDAESGESYTVTYPGQGIDSGDKGIYKAFTGATKYFLMKNFLVPTGDDPENDGGKKPEKKSESKQSQGPFGEDGKSMPCKSCGAAVPEKVKNFSISKFHGEIYCYNCQKQRAS